MKSCCSLARIGFFGLAAMTTLALPAAAQQLWSVEEVTARTRPAIHVAGVVASAVTAAGTETLTAEAATVQVEFDYLRLGMGYLELPLWDGSVVEAENAVFENRGNGNLMWTGEVPGAGYESVLFTVQDGYLVGWFGEPGGPKYVVHAGPDGRGTVAVEMDPTGDWCGTEAAQETVPGGGPAVGAASPASSLPSRNLVAAESRKAQLVDILLLYTGGTESYWRRLGGVAVGVRQLGDYLNMVFRNGMIRATANLIPVRWDPKVANRPFAQGGHFTGPGAAWHFEYLSSVEVVRLRERYQPDLVHFVPAEGTIISSGVSNLRRSLTPEVLYGWSVPIGEVFAHEIGHNLGGRHEPATFNFFSHEQSSSVRPWAFGHTDLTSCREREGYGAPVCPSTIMSYGSETWNDPDLVAVQEPFYSSVRHSPHGWTIGVEGEREVERVLHETVPVAASSGEVPFDLERNPRAIEAHWTGRDTMRVTWSGKLPSNGGGKAVFALEEEARGGSGSNDWFWWFWGGDSPECQWSPGHVTPVFDADGYSTGMEVAGLRPGGGYRISVKYAGEDCYLSSLHAAQNVPDAVLHLAPPRFASGSPKPPRGVRVEATGADSVRLHWRDSSHVETGYEVWYRKWSGEEPDETWRLYGEPLSAATRYVDVEGLEAEEEIPITRSYWDFDENVLVQGDTGKRGRYSFVVVAYNEAGFGASDTVHFEFMPGPHPEPTAPGEITNCHIWNNKRTGLSLNGYRVLVCLETPDGARRRAWDYGLDADQSGLLYFFDRDNVEVLVKVLDGCGINGYHWVFVAPVTTLSFRLVIEQTGATYLGGRGRPWRYDWKRRSQQGAWIGGNPKGRTAPTVSDTMAFACTAAEITAARAEYEVAGAGSVAMAAGARPLAATASDFTSRLDAGSTTDCEPSGPVLTLAGGHTVSMCYETTDGAVGQARDWGLASSQSGLLYFFDRDNVEVLIKVLDGCAVNGHRWVFVAPVTDLAFNLHVESPTGERWVHTNRLGQTADTAAETLAFSCASSA